MQVGSSREESPTCIPRLHFCAQAYLRSAESGRMAASRSGYDINVSHSEAAVTRIMTIPCTSIVAVTSRPCPRSLTAANTMRTTPAVGLTAVTPSQPRIAGREFAGEQWRTGFIERRGRGAVSVGLRVSLGDVERRPAGTGGRREGG
jgi:hypothetical protein